MYFRVSTGLGLALLLAMGCPAGAHAQLAVDRFEIDPVPTSAQPANALVLNQQPVPLPRIATGLATRARLSPPGSRLRCWQHGVSVVDDALAGSVSVPAGAMPLGHDMAGQNLVLLNLGTGLCVLSLAPARIVAAPPF